MQDSWRFFIQFYTSFFHLRNLSNANMKNTQLLTGYSMMKKLSRYVNVLEIKRHADGERVDVFAA